MTPLPLYEGDRPDFAGFLDLVQTQLEPLRLNATAKNPDKPLYDSVAVHRFLGNVERAIGGLVVRATEALEGTHRMTIKALGDVDQQLKNIESTVQQKKTYAQAVQEAPGPHPCTHNTNTVPTEVLAR